MDPRGATKLARLRVEGTRNAIVLFAQFADEEPGWGQVPEWSEDIFDPELTGSFSHFYDTMSFDRLRVRGEIAPQLYASEHPASFFLSEDSITPGRFGKFNGEILQQADEDIDFSQYDNDGFDGVPNSGDDDGFVDILFVIIPSAPNNFLLGPATGIAELGFFVSFETNDLGVNGAPIRISPRSGTIQQGRSFAEAVGVTCHEYGHVLGLPDFYNTGFLQKKDAPPEEDSAGIGAWGLMGWGAFGWNGNDGPNSFCAWSRMRLGWVALVDISAQEEEIRLEDIGLQGQVFKVPLTGGEYFLCEYRRRRSNHYDRNIPREGLLIWHISWQPSEKGKPGRWVVDLECADGRWQDAGYPLGQNPDNRHGGDNLDFWAHNRGYRERHGGNLGDATDPFDGMHYQAFTQETNPDSHSEDGGFWTRIEGIRLEESEAIMQVQIPPLLIDVRNFNIADADGDGIPVAGESLACRFMLVNEGVHDVGELTVHLRTDDPLMRITGSEAQFHGLAVGEQSSSGSGVRFFRFSFEPDFAGSHTAALFIEINAGDSRIIRHEVSVTAVSPRQSVQEVVIIDSLGNEDGQAQAGEFIRIGLSLSGDYPELLQAFTFHLHPLSEGVVPIGDTAMVFSLEKTPAMSRYAPEFLLSSSLMPGTQLNFEFVVSSQHATWRDTLSIRVQDGWDPSPPRVMQFRLTHQDHVIRITLPESQILEGSQIRSAWAMVYTSNDTTQLAQIPLRKQDRHYEGTWVAPGSGDYLIEVGAEDVWGNRGHSALQTFSMQIPLPVSDAHTGAWQSLELLDQRWQVDVKGLAFAPGNPQILYATTPYGVWRSEDRGEHWSPTGMMVGRDILVDSVDPFTLYTSGSEVLTSSDAGMTWESIPVPGSDAYLLATDPVHPGKLYGVHSHSLVISEDYGRSWQETPVRDIEFVLVHPTHPGVIYAGSRWDPVHTSSPGFLYHSADGGKSWTHQPLDRVWRSITVDPHRLQGLYATVREVDPHHSQGSYATQGNAIWYSNNSGNNWERVQVVEARGGVLRLVAHPQHLGLLFAWNSNQAFRSRNGGITWEPISVGSGVNRIERILPHPQAPDQVFLMGVNTLNRRLLLRVEDQGNTWAEVPAPEVSASVGTVVFDAKGTLYAGSGSKDKKGWLQPVVFTSTDGGTNWGKQTDDEMGSFSSTFLSIIDVLFQDPTQPKVMIAHLGASYTYSSDAGKTWNRISRISGVGAPDSYSVIISAPQDEGVYYIAGHGVGIRRSANDGRTWDVRHSGLSEDRNSVPDIGAFVLNPRHPETLYASLRDSIWKSRDAGLSWEYAGQVQGGQKISALAMHPLDSARLWAATLEGLYISEDQGRTWDRRVPLEPSPIFKPRIRFAPQDPAQIYFVTGQKLLETRDAGRSWRVISDDLAGYPWINDVAVDPFDPAMVYAATPWGVYRWNSWQLGTVIDERYSVRPTAVSLEQNYPNPFNGQTTIAYKLPQAASVELTIYNMAGQRIKNVVDKKQSAGRHQVFWDGTDEDGRRVGSGVFFCRLSTDIQGQTRRMVLIR